MLPDPSKSTDDIAKERAHALANLNEREIVDWFFGLRLGIDWSDGSKNFKFPISFKLGDDTFLIEDKRSLSDILRLTLYVTETKGFDLVYGEPMGLELVENSQGIFTVLWSIMDLNSREVTKQKASYLLKSTDRGFVITEVISEIVEFAPQTVAIRAYYQTKGRMKDAYKLVDAITF